MLTRSARREPLRTPAPQVCWPLTVCTPSLGVHASVSGDQLVLSYATDGARGPVLAALFLPVAWAPDGRCRIVEDDPSGSFAAWHRHVPPDREAGPVRVEFSAADWQQVSLGQEVLVVLLHRQVSGGQADAAEAPAGEALQVQRFVAAAPEAELRRGRVAAMLLQSQAQAQVTLALASCQYPGSVFDRTPDEAAVIGPADASLCRLAERLDQADPPTLLVLAGDQIYADASAGLFDLPNDTLRYRLAYQQRFAGRGPQALAGRLLQHMLMDDHEVEADWEFDDPAGRARMLAARRAYWQWQRSGDPDAVPQALWTPLRHRGFDFFMGDVRSEREPRQAHDYAQRHLMQPAQWQALCDWLCAARGRPHFVATSSMLLPRKLATATQPHAALHSDAWDGYPAALHGLLAHLCDHALGHTVFLSGDEHVGCVATVRVERLDAQGAVQARVTCHSVHTPALYAPYPFANALAEHFADDDQFEFTLARADGPQRYRCTVQTWRPALGDGFVVLRVGQDAHGRWQARASFDRARGADCFEFELG